MALLIMVVDTHKWSFGHIAHELARHAPPDVDVSVMDQTEFATLGRLPHKTLPRYHGVCQFSWVECSTKFPGRKMTTVVASHGLEFPYPPVTDDYPARIATKLRNSERARLTLPKFASVLCVSDRLVESAKPHNQNSVRVICGVDTRLFQAVAPPNRKKLVVGWCAQRDGVTKGFGEVLRPIRNRLLDVVQFQLNTRSATDALDRREMADWYRGIDVFISTSCSEGFQMPVLEAAACGRPVIATDVGGAAEVVRHGVNGFVVPAYSNAEEANVVVDHVVYWISEYNKNRDLLQQHAAESRQHVEANFTWAMHAPRWYEAML